MKKLVVIDTETGGFDADKDSILTLGACILEDRVVKSSFHMVICEPEVHTTPDALRVNGLTEEDIKQGLSPSFVVTAFEQWLHENGVYGKPTLGGHNIAGFDMSFLRRLYRLADKKMPFDYHVLDTMSIAVLLRFMGRLNVPNVKLDTLCSHYGITIRAEGSSGKHRSDEDAVATAKLLIMLMREIDPSVNPDRLAADSTT